MRSIPVTYIDVASNLMQFHFEQTNEQNFKMSCVIKNKTGIIYDTTPIVDKENPATYIVQIDLDRLPVIENTFELEEEEIEPYYKLYLQIENKLYNFKIADYYLIEYYNIIQKSNTKYIYKQSNNYYLFPIVFPDRVLGIEGSFLTDFIHIKSDLMLSSQSLLEDLLVDEDGFTLILQDSPIINLSNYNIILQSRDNSFRWKSETVYKGTSEIKIPLSNLLEEINFMEKMRFDIFIEYVSNNITLFSKVRIQKTRFPHKCDRYYKEIQFISTEEIYQDEEKHISYLVPYIRKDFQLAIVVLNEKTLISEKINVIKTELFIKGTKINFKVTVDIIIGTPTQLVLVHRGVESTENILLPLEYQYLDSGKCLIKATIPCDQITLQQFYWDIFIRVENNNVDCNIRVKKPTKLTKRKMYTDVRHPITINDHIIMPYISKGNSMSLIYRQKNKYDSPVYKYMEHVAFLFFIIFEKWVRKKKIWLVYEKYSSSAQDNSYYFFKYCYDNQPDANVYYVIDKKCPDYQKLLPYKKHVLNFMSFKHMIYALGAKLLISSEARGHCYGWRKHNSRISRTLNRKKIVFLQHGVIGLKKVDKIYNKHGSNGVTLFVTSSDYEKEFIKEFFGYNDEEVIVTGLCRWDVLEDKSKNSKEILLMPTWRNWLDEVSDEIFMNSDYYINYSKFLNDERLNKTLDKNNVTINFYIHPKFKDFISSFNINNSNIRLIAFGEEPLNQLIMRCSLLITDYSSVSWDVYYQGKPVIFYQFDFEDYDKLQGSYMDMETEIFGDRVFSVDKLVDSISHYCNNNFTEKPEFGKMRDGYFKYRDHNNCERVYNEIQSYFNKGKAIPEMSITDSNSESVEETMIP